MRSHWIFFFVFTLLSMVTSPAFAELWQAHYNMTSEEFQRTITERTAQGYVPSEISALAVAGEVRYNAVWLHEPTIRWESWYGITAAVLQAKFDELTPRGFVPAVLIGYATPEGTRYAAVWRREQAIAWEARNDIDGEELTRQANHFGAAGYVPGNISGYQVDGVTRYAVIWRKKASRWELGFNLSDSEYQAMYDRLSPQGYVPADISVYSAGGETRFAVIFEEVSGTVWEARHHQNIEQHTQFTRVQGDRGYAPYAIAPYRRGDGVSYAGAWRWTAPVITRAHLETARESTGLPRQAQRRVLPIAPVQQQTQVWCWLAIGEMLFRHYGIANVNPGGNFQCGIIGRISHPASSCASNCFTCVRPSGSNVGTLSMLGNYAAGVGGRTFQYSEAQNISPDALMENIDMGRPVLAGISSGRRIAQSDAEHVVLIVGYEVSDGVPYVIVNDPFPYPAGGNPYFQHGGTAVRSQQYRISYNAFRTGVFWHWTIFNIGFERGISL